MSNWLTTVDILSDFRVQSIVLDISYPTTLVHESEHVPVHYHVVSKNLVTSQLQVHRRVNRLVRIAENLHSQYVEPLE